MSTGHGGQVALSQATCSLVEQGLSEGVSLRDLSSSPLCGAFLILREKTRVCFRLPLFRYLADRREQPLDRSTFVDKRSCSCLLGLCSRGNIVMDTQHDDSALWETGTYYRCSFDAAHLRHLDIHQHNVRSELLYQGYGLPAIAPLSDYCDIRLQSEHHAQPLPDTWLVVHKHESNHATLISLVSLISQSVTR